MAKKLNKELHDNLEDIKRYVEQIKWGIPDTGAIDPKTGLTKVSVTKVDVTKVNVIGAESDGREPSNIREARTLTKTDLMAIAERSFALGATLRHDVVTGFVRESLRDLINDIIYNDDE